MRSSSFAASYADDTTPCWCAADIPGVDFELQVPASKLFSWFKNKHLKANPGKSHFLLSTKKPWDCFNWWNSSCCKFSRKITRSYNRITSQISVSKLALLCLNALCCISSFMSLGKRRTLIKAFVESQFNYYPLIWMLHSKTLNKNQSYSRQSIEDRIFNLFTQ